MFTRLAKEAREKAKKLEGRDNISSIIQKKYLEDLAKELEHQLNADFANLKKNLEQDMTQVSESVIDCVREFEESVGMPISNSWLNVPVDAVEAVQSGKLYAGNWTLSSRIWGMERKVIKDIHTVIAEGIAANKSAYDIAKDLEKYVDPKAKKDWNWSKVYPGTNRKVDYSAQRLARTMVSHAYQFSFVESTKDNPFIAKYKWISSHDKRVCPICKERDGKLFDKDKLPLDHPNGRCTFVSVFEKSATQISDEMAAWVKGKEGDFPKIDEYMKKKFGTDRYEKAMQMAMQGMKQETGKVEQSENDIIQKRFLEKHGFSKDNMPEGYVKFFMELEKNTEDFELFFKMAKEKGLNGPKFYNEYIVNHKWSNATKSTINKAIDNVVENAEYNPILDLEKLVDETVKASRFDRDKWIEMLNSNNEEKFNEWTKEWISNVASKDKSAVRRYTGSMYEHMNKLLRDPEKEKSLQSAQFISKVEDLIEKCKSALSKAKLPEDIVVRRGNDYNVLTSFGLADGPITKEKVNSVIGAMVEEKSFLSTSINRGTEYDDCKYEYIIKLPKGSQAVYVDSFSYHEGEKEVLVNAGGKYMIEDVDFDENGNVTKIYMTLMNLQS